MLVRFDWNDDVDVLLFESVDGGGGGDSFTRCVPSSSFSCGGMALCIERNLHIVQRLLKPS